jgi:nucleoside-diphosphate-sugar epimerase
MKTNILILGATGSIGYAVAERYLAAGTPITILVRNRAKAERLFPAGSPVEIVEGDVQDAALLKRLAADKSVIFHGINYLYQDWFGKMEPATQHIIDAAAPNQALIVFPGNVYDYGLPDGPITETTVPQPISRKGALRIELERMLQTAAEAETCRVLNVRLPDFWGPNVLNEGVRPLMQAALTGKPMPWLVNADIPHQLVYTRDAAEVIVRLTERAIAQRSTTRPYEVVNYGGETVPTMRGFLNKLARVAGTAAPVRVYAAWQVRLLGWFKPFVGEVVELLYLYRNSVVLDDAKLRRLLPDFRETPTDTAMTDTLNWFRAYFKTTSTHGS